MTILVTGGAGYIGTHTCVCLAEMGYEIAVLDNFSNSSPIALSRVEQLTNKKITVFDADITDINDINKVFESINVTAVIHFAALKAVAESTKRPLVYYASNVAGTINLLSAMERANVKCLLFSSSATVYGAESSPPYSESTALGTPLSPYGSTKAICERLIFEHCQASVNFKAISLRYFNPIGAHESGLIGEAPDGIPNNLMPFLTQVAVGRRERLTIFGGDYKTKDGTCERDYLHVMDLASGHVSALLWAEMNDSTNGFEVFNLGTNNPTSVLQLIKAFESTCKIKIPVTIGAPRSGDLPSFWADASKAKKILGWKAKRSLSDMMRDAWNWQRKNPFGYQ